MSKYLVIPLAGYGKRFVNEGYKTLKPFLKINQNNNMIDSIIKKFPKNIKKIFIVRKDTEKKYIKLIEKYENSEIFYIKPHNLGPLYSINLIKEELKKINNIFLSYCDIHWSKKNFQIKEIKNNYVYCFKGWHPFTADNNNYAFCKTKKNKIYRIKEKESFTKNWQKEPLSIGLFFFKNGEEMVNSIEKVINNNLKINNEYFPSLAFNFIKVKKVKFVDYFCHIGKPDYFEIFKKWNYYASIKKIFKKKIKNLNIADEIIIPAAGLGKRFLDENINIPKYLCRVGRKKKRMIEVIYEYLPNKKHPYLITLNKKLNYLDGKFRVVNLKSATKGQADTVTKVLNKIPKDKSIFINSCDTFSIFSLNLYKHLKIKSDILVFASQNTETDSFTNEGTWIKSKNHKIQDIFIKTKKKNNTLRLTGNFYFKNKDIFMKCYRKAYKKENEILIDNLVKEAIKMNFKVYSIIDNVYVNMGTPKLLKEFNFWENYFNAK